MPSAPPAVTVDDPDQGCAPSLVDDAPPDLVDGSGAASSALSPFSASCPPPTPHRSGPGRATANRWATIFSVAVVGVLGIGLVVHRQLLADAVRHLRGLSLLGLLALAVVVVMHRAALAAVTASSVNGLRLRRAALCSESSWGCSNAMIGGSAMGTGLKVAMLRSWAVSTPEVGAAVLGAAVAPGLAMWGLAFVETAPMWMGGQHGLERIVAPVAAIALLVQLAFWWLMLSSPGPARRLGQVLVTARDRLLHRPRRLVPARLVGPLRAAEPHRHLEELRCVGRSITRRRGWRLLGSAVASQLLLGVILFVALRGMGPGGGGASFFEVLRAFAAVRVASSFVPLPGSIGVLDVGLISALSAAGAQRPAAVAAVLVFRAVTFFLPMLTGLAAALWWRRNARRTGTAPLPGAGTAVGLVASAAAAPHSGEQRPATKEHPSPLRPTLVGAGEALPLAA